MLLGSFCNVFCKSNLNVFPYERQGASDQTTTALHAVTVSTFKSARSHSCFILWTEWTIFYQLTFKNFRQIWGLCHNMNTHLSLRFFTSHQTEQPIVPACSNRNLYKKAGSASILRNKLSYTSDLSTKITTNID